MNEYKALHYKGAEWGVFHVPTRNWCVFGTKSAILKRVERLNEGDWNVKVQTKTGQQEVA